MEMAELISRKAAVFDAVIDGEDGEVKLEERE